MITRILSWLVGSAFLRWLGRFAEGGPGQTPSTKRFAALMATTVYSLLAIYLGWQIGQLSDTQALLMAYGITSVCLMILAGFAYIVGKFLEQSYYNPKPQGKKDDPDGT